MHFGYKKHSGKTKTVFELKNCLNLKLTGTMPVLTIFYQCTCPKFKKIRGRENIAVGTWNVRTLRPAGKLEQLTHAMSRYHWNIVGLCEMRWKNFGEMSTDDGVYQWRRGQT